MEGTRILVATSNETSNSKLRTILVESGYTVVDIAKEGNEALRKIRVLCPDIAILDASLAVMSGNEVAQVIGNENICDIIVIVSDVNTFELSDDKLDVRIVGLTKPLNKQALLTTVELLIKSRKRIKELEKQIEELRANLDTRKELEKAKGLLMKNLNLSEPEAFKRIQKQSMDRGIPMKDIAKAIILTYDL